MTKHHLLRTPPGALPVRCKTDLMPSAFANCWQRIHLAIVDIGSYKSEGNR